MDSVACWVAKKQPARTAQRAGIGRAMPIIKINPSKGFKDVNIQGPKEQFLVHFKGLWGPIQARAGGLSCRKYGQSAHISLGRTEFQDSCGISLGSPNHNRQ